MVLLLVVTFIFRGEKHEKYTVFMVMSDSFGLLYLCLYGQFFSKAEPLCLFKSRNAHEL